MTKDDEFTGKKSTVHGGLSEIEMNKFKGALDAYEGKLAKLRGDVSAEWKKVEDAGGVKSSFKAALKVMNMEETAGYDWVKSFLAYLEGMGFMQQMNLFEQKMNAEVSTQGPKPQRTTDAAINETYKGGAKPNNGEAVAKAVQAAAH